MVCQEPTSTGTGMSRPRPLAASSAATAAPSKASAPMPYTVSVGSTTSRPPLSALTADAMPAARWSASAQSNISVMRDPAPLLACQSCSSLSSCAHRGDEPGSAGEIAPRRDVGERAGRDRTVRRSASAVVSSCSTATRPPGRSNRAASVDDRSDDPHAVGAAEQRVGRIMFGHFGFQLRTVGNVGRVGDDQVDRAVVVGQQAGCGDVGFDQFDGASPAQLRRAYASASAESSTATIRAPGLAAASATASAPDPVHRSTISGRSIALSEAVAREPIPAATRSPGAG